MELSKIISEIETFIKFIDSKRDNILEVIEQLSSEVDDICDQLKTFSAANECVVPNRILKEFPDVKTRVITNIVGDINEKIRVIDRMAVKLNDYIKQIRKSQEKIAKLMYEINWSEHVSHYSAFNRILEWTEKCWKTLYFLYIDISNGLKLLAHDQAHSATHLNRVSEIKLYDRSILFMASEMSHFVTMLKSDLSTRFQNISTFS